MQYTSPDYRKSMVASIHSDDIAMDFSNGASPISGRGSFYPEQNQKHQYGNLLQEVASIIEQQYQGGIGAEVPVSEAPSSSSKSVASKNTPGSSSNRSTLTRSRSRRFSAHGNQFSSQTSLSSVSKASVSSMASGVRGGDDGGEEDGYPISNNDKPRNEPNGSSTGGSLHAVHALQRFPTAHPQLQYDDYNNNNINTLAPLPITPSSNSHYQYNNHQPRHHHDYRPGVVFEYYEGEWDWLPNFDEMRPQHVGIVGNFMVDESTERELFRPKFPLMRRNGVGGGVTNKEMGNYAVRFTTNIDITQDGVYSFWVSSNDGSVLYIANTLVVENDGMHYATEVEGRILLTAGKHPMSVEFFHRNGKMLEGFRSTGPSLVVSYRAPGPVWSFGLGAGPKQTIKSSNFFYDQGDVRLMGLLNEYEVFDEYAPEGGRKEAPESRAQDVGKVKGKAALWSQGARDGPSLAGGEGASGQNWRESQGSRPTRHRVMSGDMAQLQPSARELQVQMENAKTTIKDLEQIISDQAESHRNKMSQLYEILQDTQDQVDRLVSGLKKATLFEKPQTTIVQNRHNSINGNSVCQNKVLMLAASTTLHNLKDPSFVHSNSKVVSKELVVSPDESGMRLDRFLLSRLSKDHPSVNHVNIQKWLRKRQIKKMAPVLDQTESEREEEVKMKAVTVTAGATRTETGQIWRIRLLEAVDQSVEAKETAVEESDTSLPLQDWIVYKDDRIIVLNKPAGVAVQGGTGVQSSVDSSLSVLQFEYQNRPKIVHRLDKTTSGLLVLARTRKAAQDLAKRFHDGSTEQ
ncbi:hypothetical protein BGZ52_005617, partial [Haplosporangium bisporale]